MEFRTKIKNVDLATVKNAFIDKNGKLLRALTLSPITYYKGLRRGARLEKRVFKSTVKHKVITYTSTKDMLYWADILMSKHPLGIKFLSHRHKVTQGFHCVWIVDSIEFTTQNKIKDMFLKLGLIIYSCTYQKLRYKLFFLSFNGVKYGN
jgi:hypothetical protein